MPDRTRHNLREDFARPRLTLPQIKHGEDDPPLITSPQESISPALGLAGHPEPIRRSRRRAPVRRGPLVLALDPVDARDQWIRMPDQPDTHSQISELSFEAALKRL